MLRKLPLLFGQLGEKQNAVAAVLSKVVGGAAVNDRITYFARNANLAWKIPSEFGRDYIREWPS